jgi:dolichol-phosphate mannosyltransferase
VTTLSVVVPFLNEEDCLEAFRDFIEHLASTAPFDVEVIFVNDGSTDGSAAKLQELTFTHCHRVVSITFTKNYGSHAAIRAGLQQAAGDYCTFIGIDLDEPADMIPRMYAEITQGLDVVCVEKRTVKTAASTRLFSKVYSGLIRRYAVKEYGSGGINNLMFSRKVIDHLNANMEANSSLQLQILNTGFRSTTIPMDYRERVAGVSKWTFSKKIKMFIDSFVAFSFMPIRAVTAVGVLLALAGLIGALAFIILRFAYPALVPGYASIMVLLLFGFGVTNISLGIIAEYLWRTYDAARRRPIFIIDHVDEIHVPQ